MFKCPECNEPMKWQSDQHDDNDESYSYYTCDECNISLFKYWNTEE